MRPSTRRNNGKNVFYERQKQHRTGFEPATLSTRDKILSVMPPWLHSELKILGRDCEQSSLARKIADDPNSHTRLSGLEECDWPNLTSCPGEIPPESALSITTDASSEMPQTQMNLNHCLPVSLHLLSGVFMYDFSHSNSPAANNPSFRNQRRLDDWLQGNSVVSLSRPIRSLPLSHFPVVIARCCFALY